MIAAIAVVTAGFAAATLILAVATLTQIIARRPRYRRGGAR